MNNYFLFIFEDGSMSQKEDWTAEDLENVKDGSLIILDYSDGQFFVLDEKGFRQSIPVA
jgi:hypothetical protein